MKTTLVLPCLVFSLLSCGQDKHSTCEEVLDQVPYLARHRGGEPNDSLQTDLAILKDCGKLDSIDAELLNPSLLGTILLSSATTNKAVTYRTILEGIETFRKSKDYIMFREAATASKKLERKTASRAGFEKDKALLAQMGMQPAEIEELRLFLEAHPGETMTYKEAFAKYTKSKPSPPKPAGQPEFRKLVDLDDALRTGKEERKRVLIYFTAYGSVNCRKMETNVLSHEEIKTLLAEKFTCFSAYLDDKRTDPQHTTMGQKYMKLQSETFKSTTQPQFYILDDKGAVLSEISYSSDIRAFTDFLNKGLK